MKLNVENTCLERTDRPTNGQKNTFMDKVVWRDANTGLKEIINR